MPCPQPDDPTPTDTAPAPNRTTLCVRCKSESAITIFRDSIYCPPCALAVFYTKAKSGLEYARGAGLAKYVAAAAKAGPSSQASTSSAAPSAANATKRINNGSGNAEVNVSANVAIAFSGGSSSRALLRTATQYFRPESAFVNRDERRRKARGQGLETPAGVGPAKSRRVGNAAGRFNEVGKIFVLYIDDSAIIDRGVDRTENARRMVEEESCADLHFVPLKIEDVFANGDGRFEGVPWRLADVDGQQLSSKTAPVADPRQAIKDLFASLHPPNTPRTGASSARTRVEDLHRILISTLLRRTAHRYDCAALLLGDTATRISIRLIEDLAKGAGHKLAIQGSDAVWIDHLLIVRPFKSHLMQEVDFYTSALGLQPLMPEQHVVPPTVSTGDLLANQNSNVPTMDKSSIARLTETFILNLEKGVPSTVSTIGKTGSKLILNGSLDSASAANSTSAFQKVGPTVSLGTHRTPAEQLSTLSISEPRIGSRGMKLATTSASCFRHTTAHGCALCQMPTQANARHWKRDITISSLAETAPSATVERRKQSSEEAKEGWVDLADQLCYACLLVLSPPVTGEVTSMLPAYVLQRFQTKEEEEGVEAGPIDTLAGVEDDEAVNSVPDGQCGSHKPTPQPLERSQIKAQIHEFLIDENA